MMRLGTGSIAALLTIAVIGGTVGGVVHFALSRIVESEAKQDFLSHFTSDVNGFLSEFVNRVRALRTVADAISSTDANGAAPSDAEAFARVGTQGLCI